MTMNKTVEKIINDFTVKNNFNSIKIIDTSILCFAIDYFLSPPDIP